MIIATAGHVDHGKTQLVKAITGINTDTLAEEKKRGLSIDIGFAYLPVEGQSSIGFIDVPGHDRFIKNALCGLSAADFVLLVVAADDGPMPQTEEHLSIIDLLDIRHGVIVINKVDRVPVDQIETVNNRIDWLTKNTSLQNWPRFGVSSLNHQGVEALKNYLTRQGSAVGYVRQNDCDQGNFRMAIDRSFEKKGTGLIITGTIFSGSVAIDDQIIILGTTTKLRVRGLHVQNSKAEFGTQGQRCAINLARKNLPGDQIKRGAWVVSDQVAGPVNRFDAEIRIVNNSPRSLAHWTPVHLHHAASESTARVAVLEKRPIKPGETGLVQIVSDHPLGAVHGDNFIIRDQSASLTIGGGQVIDIFPPKRGRARPGRIEWLKLLRQKDARVTLEKLLCSSPTGVNLSQFAANRNLTGRAASALFQQQEMIELNEKNQTTGFSKEMFESHCANILEALKSCHLANPEKKGFSETELLKQTKFQFPGYLLKGFLNRLLKDSVIENNRGGYSLATGKSVLSAEDEICWQVVNKAMTIAGIRGLFIDEMIRETSLTSKQLRLLMPRLSHEGKLAKLSTNLYILPSCLARLRYLAEHIAGRNDDQVFTVAEFRNASGIGRNRCIEILECFDAKGITSRIGSGRKFSPGAAVAFDRLIKKYD